MKAQVAEKLDKMLEAILGLPELGDDLERELDHAYRAIRRVRDRLAREAAIEWYKRTFERAKADPEWASEYLLEGENGPTCSPADILEFESPPRGVIEWAVLELAYGGMDLSQ